MSTATGFTIMLDGAPLPADALGRLGRVDCEEHLQLADILRLEFAAAPRPGATGWDLIDDGLFPRLAALQLEVSVGENSTVLFSGYVLETRAVFATDPEKATYTVTAFDASILLHLQTKTRPWPDMSDADIAAEIFNDYGFDTRIDSTTPTPTADALLEVQCETDMELLRRLARRNGFDCYIQPGERATGHFHAPVYSGTPQGVLSVGMGAQSNVETLTVTQDLLRPGAWTASNTDAASLEPVTANVTELGGELLGTDAVLGTDRARTVRLDPAGLADSGSLQSLAAAATTASGLSIRAEGSVSGSSYGSIIRAREPILLRGAGALYSGRYLVERVRHLFDGPSYTQSFTLVRNATGSSGEDFTTEARS